MENRTSSLIIAGWQAGSLAVFEYDCASGGGGGGGVTVGKVQYVQRLDFLG